MRERTENKHILEIERDEKEIPHLNIIFLI